MPKKGKFNWKDTEKANEIFSEVGGTLGGLERKNNHLKQEIRDDMDGVQGNFHFLVFIKYSLSTILLTYDTILLIYNTNL